MNISLVYRECHQTSELPEETACATAVAEAAAAAGTVGAGFAAVTADAEAPAFAPVALACQAQNSKLDPFKISCCA